jgi:hydroxyethylthiazole kinase-like uncharacterized protein yjeF
MKKAYVTVKALEQRLLKKTGITEELMIENAAASLEAALHESGLEAGADVLIACGSGNNGADGYALARRLSGRMRVRVLEVFPAKSDACRFEKKTACAAGADLLSRGSFIKNLPSCDAAVDCIYGTGFHGVLDEETAKLVCALNNACCFRLACDIPSGIDVRGAVLTMYKGEKLAFAADVTVTMGAYKTALFTDAAKDFCGKIVRGGVGVSDVLFEDESCDAYILEPGDMRLPVRAKKSVHKGTFGHAAVTAGEKEGAAVIAGSAALAFGAGLVTLTDTVDDRRSQFRLSPELMVSRSIPANATAVLIGCGLGRSSAGGGTADTAVNMVRAWLAAHRDGGLVIDADMFYYDGLCGMLDAFASKYPKARIVLTPHPKEFQSLLNVCGFGGYTMEQIAADRLELVKKFTARFPRTVLVQKGANTFVSCMHGVYVCTEGRPCLAKAGSGDVLAGLVCALLAQGYSAEDAAVTAVLAHGIASQHAQSSYGMTPLKLIRELDHLQTI